MFTIQSQGKYTSYKTLHRHVLLLLLLSFSPTIIHPLHGNHSDTLFFQVTPSLKMNSYYI